MAVLNRPIQRSRSKLGASLHLGPVLVIAVAAIAIVSLLRVVQTSDVTETSFAIQWLEQEKLELEAVVGEVEAEVASLASLSRVQQEAERLGLTPPVRREAVNVSVVWPSEEEGLPTRFAPEQEVEPDGQGAPWWRDLLELLPF